jgi:predicted alpha/beta-fold hydrolase
MLSFAAYKPTFWFRNAHINTLFGAVFRRMPVPKYVRERYSLPDGDFLNLDWLKQQSKQLVIVIHGLDGDSSSHHVMGMSNVFSAAQYDVLAFNFRGSGQELNKYLKGNHSGETDDLRTVIQYIIQQNKYTSINLIGYSLGANVILKYLGEEHLNISSVIKRAAVVSVPCELGDSSRQMKSWASLAYMWYFLRTLKPIAIKKSTLFPGHFDLKKVLQSHTFVAYDTTFTTPVYGFESVTDYYQQASSIGYLSRISIPTFILQAEDDTFLSKTSFPIDIAKQHPFVQLEISKYGGHVGFSERNGNVGSWAELRIRDFIDGTF